MGDGRQRVNEKSVCSVPHWAEACEALIRADPVLARLVRAAGGSVLQPRNDAFYSLSRSIVAQQISVHAAEAVWQRLLRAIGDLTPGVVCNQTEDAMRACGLSRRKASYLVNLAEQFRDGALVGKSWNRMDDEEVIDTLVEIRGIGRWTAEMFLIFHLLRPDVLPVTDIGIQKAIARHYNAGERLNADEMTAIAEPWRPWRSVASWYLWRSLDAIPVEY